MTGALPRVDTAIAREYRDRGWWGDKTLADVVLSHAQSRPNAVAFKDDHRILTWSRYNDISNAIAEILLDCGLARDDKLAVLLPDGPSLHAVYLAAEKAGLVVVGIGSRAGPKEIAYLLSRTSSSALVTHDIHRGLDLGGLVDGAGRGGEFRHFVIPDLTGADGSVFVNGERVDLRRDALGSAAVGASPARGPDDVFLINSTSGTTGLPKCVMHTQNKYFFFSQKAVDAGDLSPDDVFLVPLPSPFGFAMWAAHFTPSILGVPTILMDRFIPDAALELIERERITVLVCVSTQFIMLLNSSRVKGYDLSSLRCMFTGGETVPFERAAEFERVTGARVLQFFGSNETGALSRTTMRDSQVRRLGTGGKIMEEMQVRLFDEFLNDVTAQGGPGRPAGKGPATCLGYYDDDVANLELFTPDGWMLMGDIVELDDDGYLSVKGRTSDIIIRGGKNISAAMVEEEVGAHPFVTLVSIVAAPHPVLGEQACAYVELRPETELTLQDLIVFLEERGVTKEWFPEHLVVVDELPRSSGGKVAKAALREDAERRFGTGTEMALGQREIPAPPLTAGPE